MVIIQCVVYIAGNNFTVNGEYFISLKSDKIKKKRMYLGVCFNEIENFNKTFKFEYQPVQHIENEYDSHIIDLCRRTTTLLT